MKKYFSAACESAAQRENKILAQDRFPFLGYCNDGQSGQGPSLPRRTTFSLRPALGCLFPSGDARRGGGGGNHRRNPDRLLRRGSSQSRLGRFRGVLLFFGKQRGRLTEGLHFFFPANQFQV